MIRLKLLSRSQPSPNTTFQPSKAFPPALRQWRAALASSLSCTQLRAPGVPDLPELEAGESWIKRGSVPGPPHS